MISSCRRNSHHLLHSLLETLLLWTWRETMYRGMPLFLAPPIMLYLTTGRKCHDLKTMCGTRKRPTTTTTTSNQGPNQRMVLRIRGCLWVCFSFLPQSFPLNSSWPWADKSFVVVFSPPRRRNGVPLFNREHFGWAEMAPNFKYYVKQSCWHLWCCRFLSLQIDSGFVSFLF